MLNNDVKDNNDNKNNDVKGLLMKKLTMMVNIIWRF